MRDISRASESPRPSRVERAASRPETAVWGLYTAVRRARAALISDDKAVHARTALALLAYVRTLLEPNRIPPCVHDPRRTTTLGTQLACSWVRSEIRIARSLK